MAVESDETVETEVPLFDVTVSVLPDNTLESVAKLARTEAGMSQERTDGLMRALQSSPKVKIGSKVTKERAEKARAQFSKAGLLVQISPVLALQTKPTDVTDGFSRCPACEVRVLLPDNQQCPNCGVFVNKLSPEFLLKKKLKAQERARMQLAAKQEDAEREKKNRKSLEDALRAQIREELEEEFGLNRKQGFFQGKAGAARAAGMAGMLGMAFVGGQFATASSLPWETPQVNALPAPTKAAPPRSNIDQMLDAVGSKSTTAAASGSAGDADLDDPLLQAVGGKRVGAKGISLDQAVSASTGLAKSVGNTTAEQAMGTGATATASGGADPQADGGAVEVSEALKTQYKASLAMQLAEMGQLPRAREIVRNLKANPVLSNGSSAAQFIGQADVAVKAWSVGEVANGRMREKIDAIQAEIAAVGDAAQRTQAFSRAAVIFSRQETLPPDIARAFLTLAAESLKTLPAGSTLQAATAEWMTSLGEVSVGQASTQVKAGKWSQAATRLTELDGLLKQASDRVEKAQLHALDARLRRILGQNEQAQGSLKRAISELEKLSNLAARGGVLRQVAKHSGAYTDTRIDAAVGQLIAQAQTKAGIEKAQALVQVALLHAQAGAGDKSTSVADAANAVPGLSGDDAKSVRADLAVYTNLATAKFLHAQGMYSESEAALRRVGDYLY